MLQKKTVIAVIAGAALAAATAGAITSYASGPGGRGHGSPLPPGAAAPTAVDQSGWRDVGEARATLGAQDPQSRADLGLTDQAIAATRLAYTFPASAPTFGGISIFEVPRFGKGSCLYLLGGGGCTAHPAAINAPGQALPVQATVSDLDGPTGAIPIVLVGTVAPEVKRVTLTCLGTSSTATITGRVVTWIAPSAEIGAADCMLQAAIAGGHTFSEQL